MKKFQLYDLGRSLETLRKVKMAPKLALAILDNKYVVDAAISEMEQSVKPSPEWLEHERCRLGIAEKYAKRDDKGVCIMANRPDGGSDYTFTPDDKVKFDKEIEQFFSEHQDLRDSRKTAVDKFKAMLEEELIEGVVGGVSFNQIPVGDLPPMSPEDLEPLRPILILTK